MCDLWELMVQNDCWISISHIPGHSNIEADLASRVFNDHTEWALSQIVFDKINHHLGPLDIDLFASMNNTKLPKYVSWQPDPDCWSVDAFAMSWTDFSVYIFPPFSLIKCCLQKVQQEEATVVIIAPLWPAQGWFPILLNLLIDFPILLLSPPPLFFPWDPNRCHPLQEQMKLFTVKISGDIFKQHNFIKLLKSMSNILLYKKQEQGMDVLSNYGRPFVLKGMRIPTIPL